ncbi:AI-2E family transporter [Occultella gossypii]|uniref:AI-2E family transporter n=1 Tax=Occultella gossypii TaxID=2800820 RepID=A0ABS7S987_9MICO|nr:AI-2E family transporter [Occultella gossypii]MBZ2195851.1 AI-2E family transporter [Occultella gossypii]
MSASLPVVDRRPPPWLPRALVQVVIAAIVGVIAFGILGSLRGIVSTVLIAFVLALAMEPAVNALVRHRWRRAVATAAVMVGGLVAVVALITVFGNLFVTQLVQLVAALDEALVAVRAGLDPALAGQIPDRQALVTEALERYGADLASGILGIGGVLASGFITATGVLLIAFYMLAAGPRLRIAICRPLEPMRQARVLAMWGIAQDKLSGFIASRVVLALVSATCTTLFLAVIGLDYAVPLGLFVGVVSQFVPTVGTYIAGALPIAVAGVQSIGLGLVVLAWIIAYQQFENLILSPRVSSKALEINPAVSFVAVIAFGAVLGPMGAFIGLPLAATAQAVISTYLQRHELIDSALLRDDPVTRGQEPT